VNDERDDHDPWRDEDWVDEEPSGEEPSGEDRPEAPSRPAPTSGGEGVRILGADEAREALERGDVAPRRREGEPRFGDVPPRPEPDVQPSARFPRPAESGPFGEEAPTWSASGEVGDEGEEAEGDERAGAAAEGEEVVEAFEVDTSGPVELPHWTEPPTGEVPQILPEAELVAEEEDAWRHMSGRTPRYRDQPGDWDDVDFTDELKDEETAVGALAGEPELDEEEEFAERVAERRARRGGRPGAPPRRGAPRRGGGQPRAAAAVPGEGRDLPTALVTAGVIVVVAVACLLIGRTATAYFAAAIVAVASVELYASLQTQGYRPAAIIGILGSVALVIAAYEQGEAAYPLIAVLVVGFTLFWYLAEVVRGEPTVNVAMTLLGFGYIGIFGGFAGLVLTHPDGIGLILGMAICAVGYDVAGYFVGSAIGRTPLAPRISPNKTVEGLVAGMAASVLLGLVIVGQIAPWDIGSGLALGVAVAIAAPLGDLCESMIKRDLGVKDLGTLLPGHGGVVDRFDAILFCLPVVYYLARGLEL